MTLGEVTRADGPAAPVKPPVKYQAAVIGTH